jgi:hypothetical protein
MGNKDVDGDAAAADDDDKVLGSFWVAEQLVLSEGLSFMGLVS